MTEVVEEFKQKTYNCVLKFRGEQLHSMPLEGVTKHELQLLAFIHGADAVAELRVAGPQRIVSRYTEGGDPIYVDNEMGEYERLARKYDTIVNSGRGKKAVEECFRVRLTGFENVIEQISAVDAMEAKAAEAEAKAALVSGGATRAAAIEAQKPPTDGAGPGSIGSRVFGGRGGAG